MLNDKLLKTALVGTAKVTPIPTDPDCKVDRLSIEDDQLSQESRFLLRAGRAACYEKAGQLPEQVPQIQQAPSEDRATPSQRLEKIFEEALRKENQELLPEFLLQMESRGIALPPRLLPALLEMSEETLRSVIRASVGQKGLWLSQFNSDWKWLISLNDEAIDDVEQLQEIWNEGTFQQRLTALESIRRIDAKLGRDLLESSFSKEKAEERKQFLSTLLTGLSEADEELLVRGLSNRSKHVKAEAARLLARLPKSEIALRHQQRGLELFQKLDAKQGALKFACMPPQELPDGWKRDGLAGKPRTQQGQRSFWTEELLSRIPLSFWTDEFGVTPIELINGILNDDYAHAVITGWTRAFFFNTTDESQAVWSEPLWKYWTAMLQHRQQGVVIQALEQLNFLAQELPKSKRERSIALLLQSQHDPAILPIAEILKWVPGEWSESFSMEYLRITRALVGTRSDKAVYDWVASSSLAAVSLHPESFRAALNPWKIRDHGVQSWQISGIENQINLMLQRVLLRSKFYEELLHQSPQQLE